MATTAAIVSIGDELLAGDVENTNASWLGTRLTEFGIDVREIRVVPDEAPTIETTVSDLSQTHTLVLTTGGLGSTPDDITIEAVADALGLPLEPNSEAREHVEAAVTEIREDHPDFRHDIETAARYPASAEIIPNHVGIAPGCICGNVYVLPGIPAEMKAVFEHVANGLEGSITSQTLYTETPESHLNTVLSEVSERFDARIGCYPTGELKRIRIVGEEETAVEDATAWLVRHPNIRRDV
ncbi:competence/damage-inducible protein A [Halorubrum sp. 48-1-W]|nr:competence/damage-inducible protein A [Halorubrum sp. 48-1-W]